jgi:hypothetical protein
MLKHIGGICNEVWFPKCLSTIMLPCIVLSNYAFTSAILFRSLVRMRTGLSKYEQVIDQKTPTRMLTADKNCKSFAYDLQILII